MQRRGGVAIKALEYGEVGFLSCLHCEVVVVVCSN